jgi:lysophospholipase L1-like esterase
MLSLSSCSPTPTGTPDISSSKSVVGWGDSLTYAATTSNGVWQQANPTWLETMGADLGVKTVNFGVASQGSAEVAVRQGGLKPLITLAGNALPSRSATAVNVAAISPNDGWTQYAKAGTMTMHGSLAGVSGTLQHTETPSGPTYSFAPDAAPESTVQVPPNTQFVGDQGAMYRHAIQIIWVGTNNSSQTEAIKRDIASMVNWLDPNSNRYLIVNTIPEVTAALAATYGPRFVNLREWLASDGLMASKLSPTPEDVAAAAAGAIPPSLTVDGTHFTQVAYTAIGHHLADVVKAMNWI